jgi:hypothetical protein
MGQSYKWYERLMIAGVIALVLLALYFIDK